MCCSSDLNTSEIRNRGNHFNNFSALTPNHGELICSKLLVEMCQVAATPQQFENLLPRKCWERKHAVVLQQFDTFSGEGVNKVVVIST